MRSVKVHSVICCILLAFISVLLFSSSPVMVHASCLMPSSSTFANGFTQFCTRLKQHNNVRQPSHFLLLSPQLGASSCDSHHFSHHFVVLKAETGFGATCANMFALGTLWILRSPSCTRSSIQKDLVSMCSVLGPAPSRSVGEFVVELPLWISTPI